MNDSSKKSKKLPSKERKEDEVPMTEFTMPYGPIFCDLDGVESVRNFNKLTFNLLI